MITEGILDIRNEERATEIVGIWVNIIDCSLLEFFKIYLIYSKNSNIVVEFSKCTDVIFKTQGEEDKGTHIINFLHST